ncbi:MAG: hypothetical protein CMJ18_14365 [Phycisphaeraceae bacterium]|nr:hypothetical protein [Phycisphaeraceae bacterium]
MVAPSREPATTVDHDAESQASMSLCADLHDLVGEVLSQIPRLLMLQDRDPDSAMRGCMHPAYWRDKSSDVADLRRQEAALAFALAWRHPYPGNRWQGDRQVLHASLRALGFWYRNQNADGTFDEWYKGEHGYAVTSFSSYAVALTLHTLGDAVPADLKEHVVAALRKCGDWLLTHHDWFKTNHEGVGVAALGAIGWLLGEDRYRQAASVQAAEIGRRMHEEGWSREISGVDIGYTFLIAEYVGMHAVLNGDRELLADIAKAYRFAADFLHPDLTSGAEYGICGNPYFSRVATVILAPHEPAAAAVLRWMDQPATGPRDTSSTLKDDLRLARYAYQPLLAAAITAGILRRADVDAPEAAEPVKLMFQATDDERWRPAAKLLAVGRPGYAAWAAACHAGLVRVAFRDGPRFGAVGVDRGYAYDTDGRVYRNARYSLDVEAEYQPGKITVTAPLIPCKFVMPPYWARVGLRVATSLPYGPRWSRWLIDKYRARKGTALNQSAAGVSGGESPYLLARSVVFHDDHVEIVDSITARNGSIDPAKLHLVLDGPVRTDGGAAPNVDRRIPVADLNVRTDGSTLTIHKHIRLAADHIEVSIVK